MQDNAGLLGRARTVGLRPAWLCVGDIELFHNEVVTYADRLREAGVDTTLVVVPGAQQWLGLHLRGAH